MSIEFGMNVEGIEEVQAAFDRLPLLMHTAVQRALERVGENIHMAALRMCPVRTGFLRSTIYHRVEDWILKVGVWAPYAYMVEFGTSRTPARYFLTEAFQLNWPKLGQVLAWAWNAAIQAERSLQG
jgi:HK97 gp10 family phage protein